MNTKNNLLIAFVMGFFLLGAMDLFHTATGVQIYHIRRFTVGPFHWPLYIPLQMGLIAMLTMSLWTLLYRRVLMPVLGLSDDGGAFPDKGEARIDVVWAPRLGASTGITVPVAAAVLIAVGFVLGWAVAGTTYHLSWCLLAYVAALLSVSLFFTRTYSIAFILTGIGGTLAEWLLLSNDIGYYSFLHQDIFGRAPAWLLFVYGWGGIFCHYYANRKIAPHDTAGV